MYTVYIDFFIRKAKAKSYIQDIPYIYDVHPCSPHYVNMREAVEALTKRKLGEDGVYHPNTPGAWSDSPKVRGSEAPYTEEFKECVALQAQYLYDTYGKFPGTVQSIFCFMYVQAQHLDLDFYDHDLATLPT